jgi:Arc/MetJ-type ribon-helix-helix transcriptional regulator
MTITVRLPEKLEADLRARLYTLDVGLSEFVRQAIAEKLEREPQAKASPYELWQKYYKCYASGETDRSERVEEIVRAKLRAKHDRRR